MNRLLIIFCLICAFLPAPVSFTLAATHLSAEAQQMYDAGVTYFRARQFPQAASALQRAEERAPDDFDIQYLFAASLQNAGRHLQAIPHYTRALELQPGKSSCSLNIANCYVKLNRFPEAVPWFERYLQENPDAKDRYEVEQKKERVELLGSVSQGDKLMQAKRYEDAKRFYENAVSIKSDDAYFHYKLAEACVESNDLHRAISEYQWAHSLDPKASGAIKNIGICYANLGRIKDAIDWFQRYLDEEPEAKDAAETKKMIDHMNKKVVSNTADPQSGDYYETSLVSGKPCKWPHNNIPLKVYIDNPTGVSGFRSSYRRDFLSALDEWARASEYRLHFVTVANRSEANVTVDWTSNGDKVVPETGAGLEQGATSRSIGQDNEGNLWVTSARIRILVVHRKTNISLPDGEMRTVCLHEIGHALGLFGHSTNNEDIMFFCGTPSTTGALTDRDRRTIAHLYESYPTGTAPASAWDSEY